MNINQPEPDNGKGFTVNTIRIKKTEIIEQIINDILASKIELGITLFPVNQFFKSYLLEIKPKYLIIDSLMPFYGNKIMPKTEYIKINVESPKQKIDRYFLTKYKDTIILGEEYNFLVYKPIDIILIEKRNVLRVLMSMANMAYIYIPRNKTYSVYSAYDLSWNGIAFNADISMEPGAILKNTMVKFEGITIHMDLNIIHSTYMNGKYRIGCKILEISDRDRDSLINFILEIERQNINLNSK